MSSSKSRRPPTTSSPMYRRRFVLASDPRSQKRGSQEPLCAKVKNSLAIPSPTKLTMLSIAKTAVGDHSMTDEALPIAEEVIKASMVDVVAATTTGATLIVEDRIMIDVRAITMDHIIEEATMAGQTAVAATTMDLIEEGPLMMLQEVEEDPAMAAKIAVVALTMTSPTIVDETASMTTVEGDPATKTTPTMEEAVVAMAKVKAETMEATAMTMQDAPLVRTTTTTMTTATTKKVVEALVVEEVDTVTEMILMEVDRVVKANDHQTTTTEMVAVVVAHLSQITDTMAGRTLEETHKATTNLQLRKEVVVVAMVTTVVLDTMKLTTHDTVTTDEEPTIATEEEESPGAMIMMKVPTTDPVASEGMTLKVRWMHRHHLLSHVSSEELNPIPTLSTDLKVNKYYVCMFLKIHVIPLGSYIHT